MSDDPVGWIMPPGTPAALARAYYASIDAGDYRRLGNLLAPDFSQLREDKTLSGRDGFVRYMRDDRPNTDTRHEIDAVYLADGDAGVAVRGRLLAADGATSFGFVDVFEVADGQLASLTTYTNRRVE